MPDSDVAIASGRLKARKSVSGIRTQHAERQHDEARERVRQRRRVVAVDAANGAQLLGHRVGRRRPVGGPLGQRAADHAVHGGDRRRAGERRRLLVAASRAGPRRRCGRRTPGGPASISNRIAPAANRSLRASTGSPVDLLGRHVARRAHHDAGARQPVGRAESIRSELGPRQAEVEQLDAVRRSGTRSTA